MNEYEFSLWKEVYMYYLKDGFNQLQAKSEADIAVKNMRETDDEFFSDSLKTLKP